MSKEALKKKIFDAIEARADEIIEVGDWMWKNPEAGFREVKTARYMADKLKELGMDVEEGIGLTGLQAKIKGRSDKYNIAVMGELDALIIPEHPEAHPDNGGVHACGHQAQATNVVGLAMGLVDTGIMSELDGDVTLIGVPSEEPIELEWRQEQRKAGNLFFLGGKQEFIKAGKMDDVDICLIDHMGSDVEWKIAIRGEDKETVGGDGFIGKMITYRGVESHSGGAPWNGVNALNAVALGLMGIHSQRETFKDADAIRVHYVMTKGGDSLNVVPSEIRMELMVRGATVEAIKDACMKVDRALKAGAMAVGAEVEIENIPGYLPTPRYGTPELARVLKANAIDVVGEENVVSGMWRSPGPIKVPGGGVSDSNDMLSIMPHCGLGVGGAAGRGHSREYVMTDKYNAYVAPCKIYAGALIDLLWNGGKVAQKVLDEHEPVVAKDKYMDYWRDILGE